ncbi:MAG TPA: RodZ domain-containing protein [Thermoanaerobaculia bacterium]|nr:RodZ domain-containing protein [Thermoanaerobaculia bacterium]
MPEQEPQPHGGAASELASFGEELRREREIRGISLKEISDATKISKRFLDALERNDHKTLPAPVFTRGFVREYARYVGLNVEEMVNRYNFAAANDDRIEKPPAVEKYAKQLPRDISPKPAPKRGIPPAYAKVDRNAIWLVIILVALAGIAYWAIQNKRRDDAAEAAANVPVATPKPAAAAPTPAAAPKQDDTTLRMTVVATANSWVELHADGGRVFYGDFNAGEKKEFSAKDELRFGSIGNAAALTLTLNGVAVPSLGAEGEVIKNRIFDRKVLAELRGEPPPQGNP